MKKEEPKVKNQQDLDPKSDLFTVQEAFQRIQVLIERAKLENAEGQLQKEELPKAIQDILDRTELHGQILPSNWQKLPLEQLEKVVQMAKICFTKPAYIV